MYGGLVKGSLGEGSVYHLIDSMGDGIAYLDLNANSSRVGTVVDFEIAAAGAWINSTKVRGVHRGHEYGYQMYGTGNEIASNELKAMM